MPKPARPTLRFLRELASFEEWEDAHQRLVAATASPWSQLPKFDELEHPLIRHAAGSYPGSGEVVAQRESISSIAGHLMWKLRHGRWRAAVYEDADGQAWLVAAGIRAEGDAIDFYKSFPETVKRRGAAEFLPTADDRKRLRLEEAEENLSRWESRVHELTRDAFVAAAETGAYHYEVPGLKQDDGTLCHVRVEVELIAYDDEPREDLVSVIVTVKRSDWSRADLADHADIVIMTAIEPHEQLWDTTTLADGALFSFDCSSEQLAGLLAESGGGRRPGHAIAGQVRHWTHNARLTQSIIEGKSIEGLCGVWFVPRQDAENFETCPQCAAVRRQLGR